MALTAERDFGVETPSDAPAPGIWTFSLKSLTVCLLFVGVVGGVIAQAVTGRGFVVEWLPVILPLLTVAVLAGAALIMDSWD